MTSRDRVLKSIRFQGPDRIPLAKGCEADIGYIAFKAPRGFVPARAGADEWGCAWRSLRGEAGDQGQVVEHPLADWGRVRAFSFPDPAAPGRFDEVPHGVAAARLAGRFALGMLGKGPMHLLSDLRGFEAFLCDLVEAPARTEVLLDGVFRFLHGLVDHFARAGADGVFLFDDQAIQGGALFSMELWRRRFKPRYAALIERAHGHGMVFFLHSCGNLREHLCDLVDMGVDVIDNKQPDAWMHDPAVDAVRGRVTFSTCIDIQATARRLPPERVGDEAARLVRRLGVPAGGFIGTCYHKADLDIPASLNSSMLQAFRDFRWSPQAASCATVSGGDTRARPTARRSERG